MSPNCLRNGFTKARCPCFAPAVAASPRPLCLAGAASHSQFGAESPAIRMQPSRQRGQTRWSQAQPQESCHRVEPKTSNQGRLRCCSGRVEASCWSGVRFASPAPTQARGSAERGKRWRLPASAEDCTALSQLLSHGAPCFRDGSCESRCESTVCIERLEKRPERHRRQARVARC